MRLLLPLLLVLGVFVLVPTLFCDLFIEANVAGTCYPYTKILHMLQFVVIVFVLMLLLLFLCQRVLFALCYFILRDMALCHARGMRLTGTNIAAIEDEIAADPSYAYTDTRSSLLKLDRSRR